MWISRWTHPDRLSHSRRGRPAQKSCHEQVIAGAFLELRYSSTATSMFIPESWLSGTLPAEWCSPSSFQQLDRPKLQDCNIMDGSQLPSVQFFVACLRMALQRIHNLLMMAPSTKHSRYGNNLKWRLPICAHVANPSSPHMPALLSSAVAFDLV